ncbi:tyrosine-type recombinase/integrase [Litoricola sp.]|nr:tyrosine-type recombinase/integrase [Litorivicinus sp.]
MQHLDGAYAPNTLRAYRADFSGFIEFCERLESEPLPADPMLVAEFIQHLAETNKSSTIRRKVATISAIHRYSYLEDPTKHPEVKITMRKVNRRLGTRFSQASPINRDILEKMLDQCGDDLRGTRNRMLLLLAYSTLRRRSELTSLRIEDLTISDDGAGSILLRQSKTDQTRSGVLLPIDAAGMKAIYAWLAHSKLSTGYLLRGIQGDSINESLDPGQVSRIFKSIAKQAQINPLSVSGHSTRIGAAQDLLNEGKTIGQIMAIVGWSKVDTVMRYVRTGTVSTNSNTEAAFQFDLTRSPAPLPKIVKNMYLK